MIFFLSFAYHKRFENSMAFGIVVFFLQPLKYITNITCAAIKDILQGSYLNFHVVWQHICNYFVLFRTHVS